MPSSRTLYVYNLPADTTERDIRRLFQGVARIARVIFHGVVGQDAIKTGAVTAHMMTELAAAMASAATAQNQHQQKKKQQASKNEEDVTKPVPRTRLLRSGACAHIVLLEDEEMDKVLSMKARTVQEWPSPNAEDAKSPLEYRGLARYIYEHRASRPPTDLLKTEVNSYMAKFEEAQYERERMLAQQQNVPDDDGFITVIRRGRNTKNKDGSATVTAASAEEAREAAKKKTDVVFGNMYRFQVRERKNNQLLELRKKFEEDKEKIARMRQSRLFRPY
ncbi:ribosomal RNA-processing protein 7-domain-containing protein [Coemansia spiralis]|nr:ribosomal RNA-processing protein 7-domain-containing protein [Coemansia spiralis]